MAWDWVTLRDCLKLVVSTHPIQSDPGPTIKECQYVEPRRHAFSAAPLMEYSSSDDQDGPDPASLLYSLKKLVLYPALEF